VIDLPPQPTYQQTIAAVSACGIAAANIRISYEEELQSDVVEISDAGMATDETWLCLLRAIHPFFILELANPDQRQAYYLVAERERKKQARAEARIWLSERAMLEKVPVYRTDFGVPRFAREVEAACSLEPGSALQVVGATLLTIRREFVQRILEEPAADEMICLLHIVAASNAHEEGIRLGFFGNEAVPETGAER